MTDRVSEPPQVPRLKDFAAACAALDPESFRQRHGEAFLLLSAGAASLRLATGPQPTLSSEAAPNRPTPADRPQIEFNVFSVRRAAESTNEFISVGRAKNNDVVIPDVSLSKVHAFFRQMGRDRFTLQDAGSRNGTFVNETAVPARGQGAAVDVHAGDRVRFGSVQLTFVSASQLRELVRRLVRPSGTPSPAG